MFTRIALVGLVSAAVVVTTPAPAAADGDAFVGGLVGGILGTAIGNATQQPKRVYVQPRRTVRAAPVVDTYQRAENRRVQSALNHFGFEAGLVDGVMGRNSRAAIGRYQAFLGYPATGALTDYERTFLTSSYDRAIIGGPQNARIIASSGQGTRGLLLAYRQESLGVAPVVPAATPPQTTVVTVAPAPEAAPAPAAPVEAAAEAAAETPTLPMFLPGAESPSMASHCNRVEIDTAAQGALTEASTGDPYRALGAAFCLARTYAVDQGDSLAASVQGFSMAEIEQQCAAFAPTMADHVARLVSQAPAEAGAELQDFAVGTGMPPAQLSANARICLGVGYRTDNADLALAAALVLVGLGEQAYGELVGHHLLRGFATARRQDRGLEWLAASVAALEGGADPLVSANSDAHVVVLQTALHTIAGTAGAPVLQDASAAGSGGFVMPGATASSE